MPEIDAPGTGPRTDKRGCKRAAVIGGVGCGALLALAVVSLAAFWFFVRSKQSKYDSIVIPYIEEALPRLSEWEVPTFREYFAPGALDEASAEDLERLMVAYRRLGELESHDEPQFLQIATSTRLPYPSVVTYKVEATYTNGDATITFQLVPVGDGNVEIWHFDIDSMAILGTDESVH